MNRYKVLIAGLLAVAGVLLFMAVRPSKPEAPERAADSAIEAGGSPVPKPAGVRAGRPKDPARATAGSQAGARTVAEEAEAGASAEMSVEEGSAGAAAEAQTPREKAVAAWESLVDRVIEQKDVPAAEQAQRVKEAFDRLDKEDQMDGIHRSLNLFPDEQFPALYAILYDKTEDPEVLDAIFSDALNRPEELKNPLMKDLVKDKEHPCFFESARILDVIGELDMKPAPAPAPTPTP